MSAGAEHSERGLKEPAPATPVGLGVVEYIHIAAAAGVPVQEVDQVQAIVGVGLDGDRYAYGLGHYQDTKVSRALTLIEAEAIEQVAREHRIEVGPGATRRNLTTRGIRLNDLLGRRFWVGEVLCIGTCLCEPCQYLSDLTGLPLVGPLLHRGGLRADILRGGPIRKGGRIRVADEELVAAAAAPPGGIERQPPRSPIRAASSSSATSTETASRSSRSSTTW